MRSIFFSALFAAIIVFFLPFTYSENIIEDYNAEDRDRGNEIKSTTTPLTHKQELWLFALEWCESRGDTNIKIIDSNNKFSYGAFQFQMDTFLMYGKKYGILSEEITPEMAENGLIYDYDIQKTIARKMIEDGLGYHWKICYQKLGKYPMD
jgi:hypothetical protein